MKRLCLLVLALLVLGAIGISVYLRSDEFRESIRARIVAETERVTGGRVEAGSFQFTFPALKVTVGDFTLHGKEPAEERPLFHAKSIEADLRILSILTRAVDLTALKVTEPRIRILSDADGNTNLPEPKIKPALKRDFVDTLLDIKAKRLELTNGSLEINDRRIPLQLETEDLAVALRYEYLGPRYVGVASAKAMEVKALGLNAIKLDLEAETALEHGRVRVQKATLKSKESSVKISGFAYDLLRPSSEFAMNLDLSIRELATLLPIPIEPVGKALFAGRVSFALDKRFEYGIEGMLKSRGLAYKQGRIAIADAAVQGGLRVGNEGVHLKRVVVHALGGTFTGAVSLPEYKTYDIEGEIANVATNRLQVTDKPLPFAAIAAGPVRAEGKLGSMTLERANAAIVLSPVEGGRALQGALNLKYRDGAIEATNSYLSTPESELTFHGTLDSRVRVGARTANLADIQPFLEETLPVALENGSISFDGFVTGSTADPQISGKVLANNIVVNGQSIDRMSADIDVNRSRLRARAVSLDQAALHVTGEGGVALRDWRADANSPLEGSIDVRGARIERLLREVGQTDIPVTGGVTIAAKVKGSVNAPEVEAQVAADHVVAFDESVERARGLVKFTPAAIEVTDGSATVARTQAAFTLRYAKGADWKNGALRWKLQGSGVDLGSIQALTSRVKDVAGIANVSTDGELRIANSAVAQLRYLQGDLSVPALHYRQAAIANLQLRAATKGSAMGVTGRCLFQGARLRLNSEWNLDGKVPGEGVVGVNGASLESLIAVFTKDGQEMPFQSAVEGEVRFKGPLLEPAKFEADLQLRRIQLNPDPKQILRAGTKEQDLVVTNTRPVAIHLTANEAVIESAQFNATNTKFDVSGRAGFGEKAAWDLRLVGTINMAQLQIVNKDLLATGLARMDATIRGPLDNPLVNGSLQLSNSSLYFGDLPTGIDNVNGVVMFDRQRATVQALTGESGGGKFSLSGFVGFGGAALVYRLQAAASGVRIRYPEGASTTVNANLNLTGTSEDSLLAGTLSIVRAGFNPRVDFASMLIETARSNAPIAPQATENEYLRGMQFDLRIESTPNLEFQTSLTKGLRAEVDLRLRGNLARPSLLGNVAFNEGEIQLFGNRYTLNRGDIRFFNPTKIEPTFDLEAETRARGITVNVSFSGTPRKINAAYRSDPPLQPSEIIALLAIGRDPTVGAGLATSQSNTQSTLQGVGSLVGEAVASSLNGRLQKFFGVTRIKIDPQLTGVENIPQARLTLEQQVSKDITMTYITNLARTQEQIVRIQWDLSRQWSAIAVREENGLFGIDFQFRKRFK